MLNKMLPILLFVFLAITPIYASSPEQPNSVPIDQNSYDLSDLGATLVKESPNSVPEEPNTRKSKTFDVNDEIVSPNSIPTSKRMRLSEAIAQNALRDQNNSITADPNLLQNQRTLTLEELSGIPKKLFDKASKGDPNAQYELGGIYYWGENGVLQDYNEAFKWYTKAAEQGLANAQFFLGTMFAQGKGVRQNYNEAINWYTKAAKQGDGASQQSLGEIYYNGGYIAKNYNEALKWLLMSVQSIEHREEEDTKKYGNPERQKRMRLFYLKYTYFTLGVIYDFGQGIPIDYNEAVMWYKKAADAGVAEAQYNLGNMYSKGKGVSQDDNEAVVWYTIAAMKGDAFAQNNLGAAYENGTGVSKNYKESVFWYRQSAMQGCAMAEKNLARMYYLGKGVIEDYIEAYKWALIAGMNGDDVVTIKQLCSDKMSHDQIVEAQKRAKEFVVEKENSNESDSSRSQQQTFPKSSGTGFFISPSGYIITAAHVVEETHSIHVFTSSGKYQAKIVLLDEPTDVAILKLEDVPLSTAGTGFPCLEIIPSSGINVGDKVFTVGFPNVPIQGTESKYTDGTVSSLSGIDNNIRHFQISIPVQPGNSGGPLVTEKGNVIGVVVSKLNDIDMLKATGTLPQNVNYAVKSAFILPLLENLPGWKPPKSKTSDETMSNSDIINKARNAVALILVY